MYFTYMHINHKLFHVFTRATWPQYHVDSDGYICMIKTNLFYFYAWCTLHRIVIGFGLRLALPGSIFHANIPVGNVIKIHVHNLVAYNM